MTIGQRIKRIRQHRGMTQKYLGMLMGFPESAADVRIAQYESGSRVPKPAVINRLAAVLGVSPVVFSPTICLSRDDMMQSIFWMEELKGGDIYDCADNLHSDRNCCCRRGYRNRRRLNSPGNKPDIQRLDGR